VIKEMHWRYLTKIISEGVQKLPAVSRSLDNWPRPILWL